MRIRRGVAADAAALSELAHRAKAWWGYPPEWLALWRDELTFTEDTLRTQTVWVAENDAIVGVVATSTGPGIEVEHLWVDPSQMGLGIGGALLARAVDDARAAGAATLKIVSDPHAVAFYEKAGAVRTGEVPSRPAGRVLPVLSLPLSQA